MALGSWLRFVLGAPLNRQAPVRALVRAIGWQLRSRLLPGPHVVPWLGGLRLRVHRGEVALTGNLYAGLQEFEDMAFLLHWLRADDLFLDVGANAGSYTLLASGMVGARTVAVEPSPTTFTRLYANVQLNGLEARVRCAATAVGDSTGQLVLAMSEGSDAHAAVGDERGVPVPVQRLDDMADARGAALMKLDVEGMEQPVLEGASALLASSAFGALIVELNGSGWRYGRTDAEVVSLLATRGFVPVAYDPFARRVTPFAGANTERGNTIFVRDVAAAQTRVTNAAPVVIFGHAM
jgi:FkbM family methyltransferase